MCGIQKNRLKILKSYFETILRTIERTDKEKIKKRELSNMADVSLKKESANRKAGIPWHVCPNCNGTLSKNPTSSFADFQAVKCKACLYIRIIGSGSKQCPFCGHEEIDGKGPSPVWEMTCKNCGWFWREID